jgi:hypothetical protein
MRKTVFLAIVAATLTLSSVWTVHAAVPQLINYQGRLTNSAGVPLDTTVTLDFTIYKDSLGTLDIWSETHPGVVIKDGLFQVLLGSVNTLGQSVFDGSKRWLGVQLQGGPAPTALIPIVSVAYAYRSAKSDTAGYALSTSGGGGDITAVVADTGLAGGSVSGEAKLRLAANGVLSRHIKDGEVVNADISASAAIAPAKITGTAATLTATQAFTGANSFDGTMYIGDSTFRATSDGITIGNADTPSLSYMLHAKRNYNTTAPRFGLYSNLNNIGSGTIYGIYSIANAPTAGSANSGAVYGVYGRGQSDNNVRVGIIGSADMTTSTQSTGASYGLYSNGYDGESAYGAYCMGSSAVDGYGVYGKAFGNSNFGYALNGEATANPYGYAVNADAGNNTQQGQGVHAWAHDNGGNSWGVVGTASNNSGNGCGIYGSAYNNTGENWAGYFNGDVNITGTIVKSASKTIIDHPLDPENKYLQQSSVESPDMMTIYNGNATTDANGDALISLPDYFEALNKDFRYQLTVVGQFAQAIVAKKIENNQFTIKTDKPNVEVSWQVTGIRHDPYAEANRIQVEITKPAKAAGLHRHPEAYGLTRERSIDYQIEQQTAVKSKPAPPQEPATESGQE